MCRPWKWIWGLLPLALIAFLAISTRGPQIQADLTSRGGEVLREAGQPWARVAIEGRDATLLGDAPTSARQELARNAVERTFGVRRLADGTSALAAQSPYTWTAAREANRVTLGGFAPSSESQAAIVAAARTALPGTEVTDQMRLASGAGDETLFAARTTFGLQQLARLSQGRVALSDRSFTVEGRAADLARYAEVKNATAATLPAQMALAREAVTPPIASPYTWGAALAASGATLTGFIPSEQARADILARARAALPNTQVTDQMRLADGAPAPFAALAGVGLEQLGRLSSGSATISDTALTIEGTARTPETFIQVNGALAALPAGTTLAANRVAPPSMSPYRFQAVADTQTATLSGFVPDQAARTAIVQDATARLTGRRIVDQLQIAAGAPAAFLDHARNAVGQLARFTTGQASLADTALTVTGTASSPDAYAAALAAARQLPAGGTLAAATITPTTMSPYAWGAQSTGQAVTLTGFVPSEATRAALNERARAALPGATVTDQMQIAVGPAESAFRDTASSLLGQLGRFTQGAASIRDGAILLNGQARDFAAYDAAVGAAGMAPPQGFAYQAVDITPPLARPFAWTATRDTSGLTLAGVVPSEDARRAVVATARERFPNVPVTDAMRLASGGPPAAQWTAQAQYGLGQLAQLRTGRVGITDQAYAISGEAPSIPVQGTVVGALAQLPAGLTAQTNTITVPAVSPYVWSATKAPGVVTLRGNAPSEDARRAIAAAAAQRFSGERIVDESVLGAGAPQGFQAQATQGIDLLGRLVTGTAAISDRTFRIEGAAPTEVAKAQVDQAVANSLVQGFTGASNVTPPPPISPYLWNAARTQGGPVVLRGHVPNDATKTALAAAAAQRFPGVAITDETSVGPGAPAGFQAAATHGLTLLSRLESGLASVRDTGFRIDGMAASQAVKAEVDTAVAPGLPQGFLGASSILAPPPPPPPAPPAPVAISPYLWSATKAPGVVTLRGNVPSEDVKRQLAASAAQVMPGRRIVDEQSVGPGAPAGFQAAAVHGLTLLSRLDTGLASIRDTGFRVEGMAPSQAVKAEVDNAVNPGLPTGFLGASSILAPAPPPPPPPPAPVAISPYLWSATKAPGVVTLRGFVPSDEVKRTLAAAAAQRFAGDRIVDETVIAPGAPAGFANAAGLGLDLLGRLNIGQANIRDTGFRIEGTAPSQAVKANVDNAVNPGLPAGFLGASSILAPAPPPPPPPAPAPPPAPVVVTPAPPSAPPAPPPLDQCIAILAEAQRTGTLNFRTARAEILPGSETRLQAVVDALRRCPNARVRVEGHTDSDGSDEYNLNLSRARAETVAQWLVRAGIDGGRLSSAGFGESRPIASNDTPQGKALNRRIEFVIQR